MNYQSASCEVPEDEPLTLESFSSQISGAIMGLKRSGMLVESINGPIDTNEGVVFTIVVPPQSYANEIDAPRVTVFIDSIGKIFPTAKLSALRQGHKYKIIVSII